LLELADKYKDLEDIPLKKEEVVNKFQLDKNPNEKYRIQPKYIQLLLSKEIFEHKGWFEIKMFQKHHFELYEINKKVYEYEK